MKLTYADILRLLPVRHPLVLVDRVPSLDPGVAIVAEKPVSGSEPCYAGLAEGLAPERYAYPRSLVVESFGQASALLWLGTVRTSDDQGTGADPDGRQGAGLPMLGRLRRCRFHSSAFPGDVIRHTVRLDTMVEGNAIMSGESRVGDRTILTVGSLVAVERLLPTVIATR